jgi:S-adenosylmethionine decarboxylase proenzyme
MPEKWAARLQPVQTRPGGLHVLAQLSGIRPETLDDQDALVNALESILVGANATIVNSIAHHFEPTGVSVVLLLAESHASIHTWPEHGVAFVDIFTCGDHANPEAAVRALAEQLHASLSEVTTLQRKFS